MFDEDHCSQIKYIWLVLCYHGYCYLFVCFSKQKKQISRERKNISCKICYFLSAMEDEWRCPPARNGRVQNLLMLKYFLYCLFWNPQRKLSYVISNGQQEHISLQLGFFEVEKLAKFMYDSRCDLAGLY